MFCRPINPLRRRLVVLRLRAVDIHVGLRIQVVRREPRALNVDHNAVPGLEGVIPIAKVDDNRSDLARHHRLRSFETIPEPPPHNFASEVHLETAHGDVAENAIRRIAGIDVDQLDDPIGVRSRGRDKNVRQDRTGDGEILFQNI